MKKIRPLEKYQQHYLKKQFGTLFSERAKELIVIVNNVNTYKASFEHVEKAVVYDENKKDFFMVVYNATLNKNYELSNYETYECHHFESFSEFQTFAQKEGDTKLFNDVKKYLVEKDYETLQNVLPMQDKKAVKSKI